MDVTESIIVEIWELLGDYASPGKRNDVATKFLRIFVEQGVEIEDLEQIRGEDEHLDHALDELGMDDGEYQDEEEDYED